MGVFLHNDLTKILLVGVHALEVLYDETPLSKSPFQVAVSEGCDPTRVVAEGPGLEEGLTDKPNKFSIITRYHSLLFWSHTWLL